MKPTQIMILLTVLALSCLIAGCGGGGGGNVDNVDKTAPIITDAKALKPSDFSFPGGDIAISATATDNIGVTSVVVSIHNSLTGTTITKTLTKTTSNKYEGTASVVYSGVEPGVQTFTFTITAKDASGNTSSKDTTPIPIELDAPPPSPIPT